MSQKIILGVDAGGTKTLCAALCRESLEIHTAVGGPSNYQSVGIEAAVAVWSDVVRRALAPMGASLSGLATAGLGIAGLDRPKDETTILAGWKRVVGDVPLELVNDAYLALRAGTRDGVGVAVVSGTGCNAMGTNAAGKRFRVGGVGPEFGDLGSASDIGVEAMKASFRSLDGRGPQTALVEMLCDRLALDRLDDIVDFFLADNVDEDATEHHFGTGALAPLVFEAAGKSDEVSVKILQWAGRELGQSARAVARQLFATDEAFTLVMGGSVLQKAGTQHLKEALLQDVSTEFTGFVPVTLDLPPVAGALLYALDLAAGRTSDAGQGELAQHYDTVRAMKTNG
jgi:N-acetylglucosamine kinase-like BadF-type ATPase